VDSPPSTVIVEARRQLPVLATRLSRSWSHCGAVTRIAETYVAIRGDIIPKHFDCTRDCVSVAPAACNDVERFLAETVSS